jgi:hypothetical protein
VRLVGKRSCTSTAMSFLVMQETWLTLEVVCATAFQAKEHTTPIRSRGYAATHPTHFNKRRRAEDVGHGLSFAGLVIVAGVLAATGGCLFGVRSSFLRACQGQPR